MPADDPRKQAEIDYPRAVGDEGREWIRSKPFGHDPYYTARLLIDFGYVVRLLELHAGSSLVELGCGSGWMTRLAARQGVDAEGYDISPEMIEIARAEAEREGLDVQFAAGDYEELDLGHRFDACLLYDALHHTPRADLVFASARRALKPGGRLLLAEQATASSARLHADRALPQQPQAPVLEHAAGPGRAPGGAVRLPRARSLLDADLAARPGRLS